MPKLLDYLKNFEGTQKDVVNHLIVKPIQVDLKRDESNETSF